MACNAHTIKGVSPHPENAPAQKSVVAMAPVLGCAFELVNSYFSDLTAKDLCGGSFLLMKQHHYCESLQAIFDLFPQMPQQSFLFQSPPFYLYMLLTYHGKIVLTAMHFVL